MISSGKEKQGRKEISPMSILRVVELCAYFSVFLLITTYRFKQAGPDNLRRKFLDFSARNFKSCLFFGALEDQRYNLHQQVRGRDVVTREGRG